MNSIIWYHGNVLNQPNDRFDSHFFISTKYHVQESNEIIALINVLSNAVKMYSFMRSVFLKHLLQTAMMMMIKKHFGETFYVLCASNFSY